VLSILFMTMRRCHCIYSHARKPLHVAGKPFNFEDTVASPHDWLNIQFIVKTLERYLEMAPMSTLLTMALLYFEYDTCSIRQLWRHCQITARFYDKCITIDVPAFLVRFPSKNEERFISYFDCFDDSLRSLRQAGYLSLFMLKNMNCMIFRAAPDAAVKSKFDDNCSAYQILWGAAGKWSIMSWRELDE